MAVIVGAEKMSILSICLVFQFAKFISFIYLKTDVIIEREREREIESSFPEWKKYENLSFGSILLYLEWIKIFHYETCSEIHFYLLNNFREREHSASKRMNSFEQPDESMSLTKKGVRLFNGDEAIEGV